MQMLSSSVAGMQLSTGADCSGRCLHPGSQTTAHSHEQVKSASGDTISAHSVVVLQTSAGECNPLHANTSQKEDRIVCTGE